MIDPDYPTSPLDPPFVRDKRAAGAFRFGETLVIHGFESDAVWVRSTNATEVRR